LWDVDPFSLLLARLSPADRLRLVIFDAELRRLPRPLLDALWLALDCLEGAEPDGLAGWLNGIRLVWQPSDDNLDGTGEGRVRTLHPTKVEADPAIASPRHSARNSAYIVLRARIPLPA
jgi:hypothetical protein